jgi:hypothetical protein
MTFEEYENKSELIIQKANAEELKLMQEYCLSNNPYNIGDIFTDHWGSIKIVSISCKYTLDKPCCVYTGIILKKDCTPAKNNKKREAYQCHDAKINIKI